MNNQPPQPIAQKPEFPLRIRE